MRILKGQLEKLIRGLTQLILCQLIQVNFISNRVMRLFFMECNGGK